MMASKYLNQTYGKWTVLRESKTKGGHKRFTLMRKTSDGANKYITLRDNALTEISRGTRTINSYIYGKKWQRMHKVNEFRNNVFYTYD